MKKPRDVSRELEKTPKQAPPPRTLQNRAPQFQPGQTHLGLPTRAFEATKFATETDFCPGSGDCCDNAGRGFGTGQQKEAGST